MQGNNFGCRYKIIFYRQYESTKYVLKFGLPGPSADSIATEKIDWAR